MLFDNNQFTMTEEEYCSYDEDYTGLCIACGEGTAGCEPDAREYQCDGCGRRTVYGVPELLIMGLVEIKEEEDE